MAKECPQCNQPNLSKANFCVYCGTLLSEDGNMDEEAKLHKELNDAKQHIELLKKSLADAHAKIKNDISVEDFELLNTQLAVAEQNKKSLEAQITDKNKEIESIKLETNKKKNGSWIFLLLISVVLGIMTIYFYSKSELWKKDYYTASRNGSDSQREINTLKNENIRLKEEYHSIQNTNESLQSDIANLKANGPKAYNTTSRVYLYKAPEGDTTGLYYNSDETIMIYTTNSGYGLTYYGWVLMAYLNEIE